MINKLYNSGRWCSAAAIIGLLTFTGSAFATITQQHFFFNEAGNVLIADQFNNRVIETDPFGNIVWQYGHGSNDFSFKSPIGVNDAERIGQDTLVAATGTPPGVVPNAPNGAVDSRVFLIDPHGRILWQYGKPGHAGDGPGLLNTPVQSTGLPNGDVMITDQGNNRIIEVNRQGRIVWQYPGSNNNPDDQLNSPNSAELLPNGNILISDENNNRVIEVTRTHIIVHTYTAGGTLGAVAFASRLTDGDILMTDAGNSRAVEVDTNDVVVWQYYTNLDPDSLASPGPSRAVRLKNGDTLISDQFNNRVIRVDTNGDLVSYYGLPLDDGINIGYSTHSTQDGLYAPYDAKIIGDYTGLTPPANIVRN